MSFYATFYIFYDIQNSNTTGSGKGSIDITYNSSVNIFHNYQNLNCTRTPSRLSELYYDVEVTFESDGNFFTITALYDANQKKVVTKFNNETCEFSALDVDSAKFVTSSNEGTITQLETTINLVDTTEYSLQQTAYSGSTLLYGTSLNSSKESLQKGGPILCQAYVASLVNPSIILNEYTLVDAIGICIAGYYI